MAQVFAFAQKGQLIFANLHFAIPRSILRHISPFLDCIICYNSITLQKIARGFSQYGACYACCIVALNPTNTRFICLTCKLCSQRVKIYMLVLRVNIYFLATPKLFNLMFIMN